MAKYKGRKIDNATKLRGKQAYKRSLETQYPNDGLGNQPSPEDLFVKVNNFARMFTNKRQNDNSKYIQFAVQAEGNTLVINMRLSDHYYPNTFPLMKADEKTSSNVRYSLCFRYGGEDDVINPDDNISDTKDGATNILYEIDGYHLYNMKDVELLKGAVQDLLINGRFELPFSPKSQRMLAPLSLSPQNALKLKECINHIARKIITENKQYNTMTKNKVRLTESQLHNIIKESVKKVLSELDWKTYDSAAQKEYNKIKTGTQNWERIDNLQKAKSDAFNKKYFNNGEDEFAYFFPHYGEFAYDDFGPSIYDIDKDIEYRVRPDISKYDIEKVDRHMEKPCDMRTKASYDDILQVFSGDEKKAKNFMELAKEYSAFKRGDYEYEPNGRGWHLKDNMDESIRRAIRKVLR